MNTKNKHKKYVVAVTVTATLIIAILMTSFAIYVGDYYHADVAAIEAFTSSSTVDYTIINDNAIVFEPKDATMGLIFYPGGKVEHTAYIPLMQSCAEQDILCIIVKMPFNLAVFDINAADEIQEQYPQIEEWYIGGHSLGGSMAASYLSNHKEEYKGLILLGSYSTENFSDTSLNILSIYGSEDRILNREKYESNKTNLPKDFTEIIISGGCHAYFGMYGKQKGDGNPKITYNEQIAMAAHAITNFILK